jgi:hypothetical protein
MRASDLSSNPPGAPGSLALRLATIFGLAGPAVLVCAAPAAFRVCGGATAPLLIWPALAAAALGPMISAIVVFRAARQGLRAFAGPVPGARTYGMLVALAGILVALSLLASVLRAATHNRALAGVTFAIVGLGLSFASVVIAGRMVVLLEGASPVRRAASAVALALAGSAAVSWVGLRFVGAAQRDPASATSAGIAVDVLAFSLTALFAARPSFAARRSVAILGAAISLLVAVWGLSALRHPAVRAAIQEKAPVFAPLAGLVPSS